jgi:succinate-semialdehyde dehydrogenase / glutarate-semialdehyde dehydrogenase
MSVLIDGEWRDLPARRAVYSPADGAVVGEISYGDAADATRAADAAGRALPAWSVTPARARAEALLAGARRLADRAEKIADLLCRETGKRLPEARAEIAFAGEYFRWFAEQARRPAGTVYEHEAPGKRHYSVQVPAGVAAVLTPWNFPVSIQARKLAPALAAGCTVVSRASEKAPLAAAELVRALAEDLPAGVLNLVHGPAGAVTDALLAHPAVRVASFTGSTEVGRRIMATAAARVVRPLLELGGDAPFLVFDDADVDAAVEGAMIAKFRNNGQSCIAANRFFVQAGVYDEFTGALAARVDAMTVGDPLSDVDLGPLIDDDRVRAVSGVVDEALAAGARLLTKAGAVPAGGSYLAPALLTDVPADTRLATTEVFGPAAGVFRFTDEAEVFASANATEMGLAGYAYTRDVGRVRRVTETLEVGILGVNDPLPAAAFVPMGGVKQSGLGREGADVGLAEFTETRYVCLGE